MSRVLLVTYEFPPKGGPGVQRPLKLTKYLTALGWEVTVLTVADPPGGLRDPGLLEELPGSVRVVRAWSLEPTRLLQLVKRLRGASESAASGQAGAYSGAPPGFIRLVQAFFSPDEKRLWEWWAVPAALRDAAVAPVDVILSSGPPHTAHVIARELSKRMAVPYVMDLRDQWVGNYFFRPLTPVNAWLTRRAEARCARDATAVVTTAPTVTAEIASRYPGIEAVTIYNGYDPEDLPTSGTEVGDDRIVLTHAGTFSGRRTPRWFFEGLALAEKKRPQLASQLVVRFAGLGPEVQEMAAEIGVRSKVDGLGYLPHSESVSVLAESTATLLILSAGPESRVTIPGKVFEYLATRRPMLALVGNGDVATLLSSVEGVRVVEPEDPQAIAEAILELADKWDQDRLAGPTEEQAAPFARPVQVARYAELLEQAIRKGVR